MTLDAPPPPLEPTSPPSTMRRDLISAYVASGMKVASWAVVSKLLIERGAIEQFALFSFLRGTLSFLNYTSLGLAPAIIHRMSHSAVQTKSPLRVDLASQVLPYESKQPPSEPNKPSQETMQISYSTLVLAVILCAVGIGLAWAYSVYLPHVK